LNLVFNFLFGALAVNVVFLVALFWTQQRDPSTYGEQVFAQVLRDPIFWAVSVVAFGLSFYLAR
jgi:hypothetical protein